MGQADREDRPQAGLTGGAISGAALRNPARCTATAQQQRFGAYARNRGQRFCVLRRQRDLSDEARVERLGSISVGHMHNLRSGAGWRDRRRVQPETRPAQAANIGVPPEHRTDKLPEVFETGLNIERFDSKSQSGRLGAILPANHWRVRRRSATALDWRVAADSRLRALVTCLRGASASNLNAGHRAASLLNRSLLGADAHQGLPPAPHIARQAFAHTEAG